MKIGREDKRVLEEPLHDSLSFRLWRSATRSFLVEGVTGRKVPVQVHVVGIGSSLNNQG